MTLCEAFESTARWTWHTLGSANRHAVRFGEDAVTSAVVLGLKEWGPLGVRVADTRDVEAVIGADIEFWYQRDNGDWCGFAVQAKKGSAKQPGGGRYDSLSHYVRGIRQVDLLMAYAAAAGVVPLYLFFNFDGVAPVGWAAGSCGAEVLGDDQLGCTIIHAGEVGRALRVRSGRTFRWLHGPGGAIPLRNVCCPIETRPKWWTSTERNDTCHEELPLRVRLRIAGRAQMRNEVYGGDDDPASLFVSLGTAVEPTKMVASHVVVFPNLEIRTAKDTDDQS